MPSISVSTWLITRSAAPPKYTRQIQQCYLFGTFYKIDFCILEHIVTKNEPPSPTFPPLALAMESNSSKNNTQGAALRA